MIEYVIIAVLAVIIIILMIILWVVLQRTDRITEHILFSLSTTLTTLTQDIADVQTEMNHLKDTSIREYTKFENGMTQFSNRLERFENGIRDSVTRMDMDLGVLYRHCSGKIEHRSQE